MSATATLRFDELGCFQFERFCATLLDLDLADSRPWGAALSVREGATSPDGRALPGPTLVLVAWLRDGSQPTTTAALGDLVRSSLGERIETRSLLLLTNVADAAAAVPDGVEAAVLGPEDLSELVRARPDLRYRVPSLLGVADLDTLLPADVRAASTGDLAAAAALARLFVPTSAYARALAVLEQHRFVVLSGPPEMGKTAAARMLGLAAVSDAWELHECIRPDELWARFRRDRRQIFVADDAFGSTEYRPDAAEHWALELDRVLQALDDRHRLIWTSRPGPLKAGLRRIHREHGVERFPQPAEVAVSAAELETAEKALILFRHALGAGLPHEAVELVRRHGLEIVSHPHFTPERIRRFVGDRLLTLASRRDDDAVAAAVAEEIREPTVAMSSSYRSLAPDHRAVLLALLDTPAAPVPERELAVAVRRHSPSGLAQPVAEVVDRLADHFLHVVEGAGVGWVHPSWRDLVIDELAADPETRRRFLRDCSVHGAVLALSAGGGATGERTLPLLLDDADWDALADCLVALAPTLDAPEVTLLLDALAEALPHAEPAAAAELAALAREVLEWVARSWEATRDAVPVGLLAAWLALAATLPEPPVPPVAVVATTWVELDPGVVPDLRDAAEIVQLDDWLALVELLQTRRPAELRRFDFPARHADLLAGVVADAHRLSLRRSGPADGQALARTLRRVARVAPLLADEAMRTAHALTDSATSPDSEPAPPLRELSPEMLRLLDEPPPQRQTDAAVVERVLRDL